jgi:hypothetical protein
MDGREAQDAVPAGGVARADEALSDIAAVLRWPRCAGRPVEYAIVQGPALSAAAFAAWLHAADADGYTEIHYAIDHRPADAVRVTAWASMPRAADT